MNRQPSIAFLINKMAGVTSFKTMRLLKQRLNISKVGHTGTLDPFATGLIIVLTNGATKLSNLFLNQAKTYRGAAHWGQQTDTGDKTGVVITEQIPSHLTAVSWIKKLKSALFVLKNEPYWQKPPLFSAVKIKGKKLYEYAWQNLSPVIKPQERFIYHARLDHADFNNKQFSFTVKCSKGTYVRSFVEDWAALANGVAYTNSLERIAIGNLELSKACTVDVVTWQDGFDIIKLLLICDFLVYQAFADMGRYIRLKIPIVCIPKKDDIFFYCHNTSTLYWFKARLNRFYEYYATIKNVVGTSVLAAFMINTNA